MAPPSLGSGDAHDRGPAVLSSTSLARSAIGHSRGRVDYFPREVFFLGFGLPGLSVPAAAARFFCFFVAIEPPHLWNLQEQAS